MKTRALLSVICVMLFLFVSCDRDGADNELRIAEDVIETSPDSTLKIIGKLDYGKLNDESKALYGLLYTAGRYKCSLPVAVDTLIDRSIGYYRRADDSRHLANAYYYKGCISYLRKDYVASIKNVKRAEGLSEELDDELLRNKIYERLTYINYSTECNTQSLFYSKKFMDSSLKMGDAELILRGFACVASSYYSLGHADSAAIYINKCMPYISKLDSGLQSEIYANLGALFCKRGDSLRAEKLLKKSIRIKDNAYAHYILGGIEIERGRQDNARHHLVRALNTEDEKLKMVVYECLADHYDTCLNIPKAYEYVSKELAQIKKRYEAANANDVLEYQMRFDAEQTERNLYNYIKVLVLPLFSLVGGT